MLRTKFQGHRPFGYGEEGFLRFLLYMGMAAIMAANRLNNFSFPYPIETPDEIWLQSAQ